MGISQRLAVVIALGCGALLAACAETELVVHTVKVFDAMEATPEGGGFKLGAPYEVEGVWYHPRYEPNYDETGVASWYGGPFHGERTANGERYDMNALSAAHRTLPLPSLVRVSNLENGRALVLRVNDRGPFRHGRIIDVSRRTAQLLGFERKGTAMVRVQFLPAEKQPEILLAGLGISRDARAEPAGLTLPNSEPTVAKAPVGAVETSLLTSPANGSGLISSAAAAEFPRTEGVATSEGTAEEPKMFVQAGAFADHGNATQVQGQLKAFGSAVITPVEVDGRTLYRVRVGPFDDLEKADAALERVIDVGQTDARLVVD